MECGNCGNEMVLDCVDENGAHYECYNCDATFTDTEVTTDIMDDF